MPNFSSHFLYLNFMKYTKSQALMYLITELFEHRFLYKSDCLNVLEIDDNRFHHYMQDIRAFLTNFNKRYENKYIKQYDRYELIEE